MSEHQEVRVPDIGDFDEVEVIEVLVAAGQEVAVEDSLVTLESDKATMEIPSPVAGRVEELLVAVGDKVAEGSVLLRVAAAGEAPADRPAEPAADTAAEAPPGPGPSERPAQPAAPGDALPLVVLGSGPGGYTAAFRAADLGMQVTLIERYPTLGGVCLNVGCIPSKALLHTAGIITAAEAMAEHGVRFGEPQIDLQRLRGFKDEVVGQLTGGLAALARKRGVEVVQGSARFLDANTLGVAGAGGEQRLRFEQCIIAAGSQAAHLPGLPEDPRILDSTGALELRDIPGRLLVVGGGIIGLELACVYDALGSSVTVAELTDTLMPGADRDLVKPLADRIGTRYAGIYLGTRVAAVEAGEDALRVRFDGGEAPASAEFDAVLVAIGRRPNGKAIEAANAGVECDERGFIAVDAQQRTNRRHIFAIGDIVGEPMLAHKATHEGKVAAEVAAGRKSGFDARVVPAVAYTDPEVAWAGLTETGAKAEGRRYGKGVFPWAASGRALGLGRGEGLTKLLFDEETGRLIGAGMVGPHAGDLVAEAALAIEMGADAADIGLTIHPHPTLSETVAMAAEAFEGTITDLYLPGRKSG